MADLLYVGFTLLFVAASGGLIVACERLRDDRR